MVSGTVMIADDGGASDGVSKEDCYKYKIYIHDRSIGGDAIFPGNGDQLQVIERIDYREGQVRHQFGGTVGAGFDNRL